MTDLQPKRLTTKDHASTRGLSAMSDRQFSETLAEVNELRKEEREYWASLPVEPKEALAAILQLLGPKGGEYPAEFERALHTAHVVQIALSRGDIGDGLEMDSVRFLMLEVVFDLLKTRELLERTTDICRRPSRAWMFEAAE